MTPQLAGRMLIPPLPRRHGLWRAALSGLTPSLVAIVAALLFARALMGVLFARSDASRILFLVFHGYVTLLVMTAPMLIAIVVTSNLGPQRGTKRIAALATAVVLSTFVGVLLRMAVMITWFDWRPGWDEAGGLLLNVWPRYTLFGGTLTVALEFYRREIACVEATQQAAADRAALERQMAESRLRVLQAQIEPHFLFNTLANVRRLYDTDQAGGRTMLDNLMRYLEVALPRMREREATLGRDAELAEAYLQIQQIRMGRRLVFGIDIPAALRAHPAPPMMLLILVENAVKHGVNPSPHGGAIRVTACSEAQQLILTVADSGVGLAAGSGTGTGLANIRARLAAQFGPSASLSLENNELGGVTATIVLPLSEAVKAS
jgi:signal transduction histidine kinase